MDKKSCKSPPGTPSAAELQALVRRAQKGDAAALPELRELLARHPDVRQRFGDVAARVEEVWIELLTRGHPLGAEAIKLEIAKMKAELLGERPTPVEKMLVDQIVSCWLQVRVLEQPPAEGGTIAQGALRLKRLNSASKRHLDAVKMLATLRTLLPKGLAIPSSIRMFEAERQAN